MMLCFYNRESCFKHWLSVHKDIIYTWPLGNQIFLFMAVFLAPNVVLNKEGFQKNVEMYFRCSAWMVQAPVQFIGSITATSNF